MEGISEKSPNELEQMHKILIEKLNTVHQRDGVAQAILTIKMIVERPKIKLPNEKLISMLEEWMEDPLASNNPDLLISATEAIKLLEQNLFEGK